MAGGRSSTRLYKFLRKADLSRDIDRLLKAIEDELDSTTGVATVPGFLYDCDPSVQVRDLVYIANNDWVNRASGASITTSPAVGIVRSKPSSIRAEIIYGGEIGGFTGLVAAQTYYMSDLPGQVTLVPPSDPGSVVQKIGFARSATTLVLRMDRDFTAI